MTPRPIDQLSPYDIDQEIGHLVRLPLTPLGAQRLKELREKRFSNLRNTSSASPLDENDHSSYKHNDDDTYDLTSAAIGFGLGSLFDSSSSIGSFDSGSSFSAGGGDFGGAGGGSDW